MSISSRHFHYGRVDSLQDESFPPSPASKYSTSTFAAPAIDGVHRSDSSASDTHLVDRSITSSPTSIHPRAGGGYYLDKGAGDHYYSGSENNMPHPEYRDGDAVPFGSEDYLAANAAPAKKSSDYQNFEYAERYNHDRMVPSEERRLPFVTLLGDSGNSPLANRIEDKRRGIGVQRYPAVAWVLAVALIAVIIYELVLNGQQQGTPFSFKPTVNPMLGPSSSALIYAGARFPPCMKIITDIPLTTPFACMNDTANPPDRLCSIEAICGSGGFHGKAPNQAFRFVTPVFLHAGLVHLLLNLLALLTASAQIEREMGSLGFLVTYMAAGIFGNVLGGNFARPGVPSTGASGAIFGIMAVEWTDLFFHWRYIYQPGRRLVFLIINLLVGIAIGFIPFVDNFAHLGGLLMGFLIGTIFYPVITTSKKHKMIILGCKIAALPIAVVLFVVLTRNFYTSNPYAACTWCRYLSCIPMSSNSYCKGTGLSIVNTTTN